MKSYKLLTPGPLTTSPGVKAEMLFDHCTWDEDYKAITQRIRKKLLDLAMVDESDYTAVLMQGSGSFGVESVLTSAVGPEDHLLILCNGVYSRRMEEMAKYAGLNYSIEEMPYNRIPDAIALAKRLDGELEITHVAMVHNETTTGILNDIRSIGEVVKARGRTFIVDAMSSFGGMVIPMAEYGIDFLISSSNKCIQGVPGFSFILCKRVALQKCQGQAKSLCLDLYDQWATMEIDGKWRYTSPTHSVLAFSKALEEMEAAGGIAARNTRYQENNARLIEKMKEMGFKTYITQNQGPIITSFCFPEGCGYTFNEMYHYIKERGYAIYPGKVTDAETFRIGNIGEIYKGDIDALCAIIFAFLEEKKEGGQ
ncbi:2-aminoethylphosphonate--pyruvate transaminase [Eubacterium sp.]|uniref:2-aminoethylphosphonate--pyruvate transaminase n=1 Tax=Eubacterium sp. TaxID=142586 RepID=UPI002FCB7B23